jgi:hypothetical protein
MRLDDIIKRVLSDVEKTYGDMNDPNYAIISDRLKESGLPKELRKLMFMFWVKEVTDVNEDVCRSFLLKGDAILYRLDLSVVGDYAMLMEIHGQTLIFIDSDIIKSDKHLRSVFEDFSRFIFLNKDVLECEIDLNLDDEGRSSIYNALFSSGPIPSSQDEGGGLSRH